MSFAEKRHELAQLAYPVLVGGTFLAWSILNSTIFEGRLSYAKMEHACNPVIFKNDEYDPFT